MPTLLVVEDDRAIATVLVEALTDEGYAVDVAHDGVSALARLRTAPPDLAIVDVSLPGLTGDQIVQTLRQEGCCLPIMLITALPNPARFQRIGATAMLRKPFDLLALLTTVAGLLDTHPRA